MTIIDASFIKSTSPLFRFREGGGVDFIPLGFTKKCTIGQLLRLFHTLRHLRPRQVAYQVFYRLTGRLAERNAARTQVQKRVEEQGEPTRFNFLNREVIFPSPIDIDWNYSDQGKLWTYNLNYFEFLDAREFEKGAALINAWIDKEPTHKDGWEPYPISLRLVNWIYFHVTAEREIPGPVKASIRRQYDALWRKREYQLGGNHLLENALTLSLTARLLTDEAGAAKADRLLIAELAEQYLPDGANYELSPMYHLILLERMITVYHCLKSKLVPAAAPKIMSVLRESLTQQLGWATAFCTPDGRYAHFNDSTNGIAPPLVSLLNRARALGLDATPGKLGASGYRRFKHQGIDLWIDAAAIGPAYIPGHAHADNLTFELHLNGQPLIVDPAISTYEKNARRAWERSTVAHNTVTVNDQNSSDVWGGFRVGRRAKTTLEAETPTGLTASHNGYGTTHRRTFGLNDSGLCVTDKLSAALSGVARFHFGHGVAAKMTENGCLIDGLLLTWSDGEASLKNYQQAVGWNELRPARVLEIKFTGKLTTTLALATK